LSWDELAERRLLDLKRPISDIIWRPTWHSSLSIAKKTPHPKPPSLSWPTTPSLLKDVTPKIINSKFGRNSKFKTIKSLQIWVERIELDVTRNCKKVVSVSVFSSFLFGLIQSRMRFCNRRNRKTENCSWTWQ
jgi:hypothetical protein